MNIFLPWKNFLRDVELVGENTNRNNSAISVHSEKNSVYFRRNRQGVPIRKNISEIEGNLQDNIVVIEKWCKMNNIEINPIK